MRDFKRDREICEKYDSIMTDNKLSNALVDKGLFPSFVYEFAVKAHVGWPAALDEIDRLNKVVDHYKLVIAGKEDRIGRCEDRIEELKARIERMKRECQIWDVEELENGKKTTTD